MSQCTQVHSFLISIRPNGRVGHISPNEVKTYAHNYEAIDLFHEPVKGTFGRNSPDSLIRAGFGKDYRVPNGALFCLQL